MVTPRERITIADNGTVETLIPGRDRLTVDHPFVARHPEKFDPCWNQDKAVIHRMMYLLDRGDPPGLAPPRPQ